MALKIILRQDVPNLGQTGEIKQVAPGYFRNFLLPRGLAVEATAGQIRALEANASLVAGRASKERERASEHAEQLSAATITIPVKMGEQGRMYGSVTSKDIADALLAQANMQIDRHKIELREPLKTAGTHPVPVKLEHGVAATINVELVPQE